MAIIALHSAATGLSALSTQIDVIANNLANVNTTGFKASRANFEDLLYQELAQPGLETANGNLSPTGIHVGLGTRIVNTDPNFATGSPINTGRELDLMVDGRGFFALDRPESPGGLAYTRAGNFFVNGNNEIVLGDRSGLRLDPPVTVPDDTIAISIGHDGRIEFTLSDGSVTTSDLQITTFINPKGLRPVGGNLYEETEASGDPITGEPALDGRGQVLQGFLESSNVDPVTELIEMIKAQRAFEMNSQAIQSADEALQVISNLRRF